MRRITVVVALVLSISSCAWFQKNESKIACAGVTTVQDLPELIQIVGSCAAIAVTSAAVLPCVTSAAASKWPEEIIACVSGTMAGKTACPAMASLPLKAGKLDEQADAKLKEAVSGYRFQ
jgi:hypothetical protein